MNTKFRSEAGDTLLEILVAIVIIGLVVGAYFATYSTQGSGSTAHRILGTADGVLRSYAEATKSAVRAQCASSGASNYTVSYTPPTGYTVNALNGQPCPPRSTPGTTFAPGQPWAPVTLTVTMPNSQTRSLSLVVRSP
jgi:prepilin-type N-terminal cleavage/methylation domain-containing protein